MEYQEFTKIEAVIENGLLAEISQSASDDFDCLAVEEFELNEEKVDNFLGDDAFCGGDLPAHLLTKLESEAQSIHPSVRFYFDGSEEANSNIAKFVEWLERKGVVVLGKSQNKAEDWDNEWRKHYSPIKVSEKINIVPSWFPRLDSNSEVYINPGMGFGTGEHETTFLCLKMLDFLIEGGKIAKNSFNSSCLDFGCGSGILGIAAMKFAEFRIDFCDIDPRALDNCLENLAQNFAQEDIVRAGTLGAGDHRLILRERFRLDQKYQLVFANILKNVLIEESDLIVSAVEKNGFLVLSGILVDQIDSIVEKYKMLKLISVMKKGDWASILLEQEK